MSNEIEKMTRKSQEAMQAAAKRAETDSSPQVEPEHLLLELIMQSEGIVPRVIEQAQGSVKNLTEHLLQSHRYTGLLLLTGYFWQLE